MRITSRKEFVTLWNGRRTKEAERLDALIPAQGEIPFNPDHVALELYRQFVNAYHDIFNNHGGNWHNHSENFSRVSRFYGIRPGAIRDIIRELKFFGVARKLEELGDVVIDAALKEQFGDD